MQRTNIVTFIQKNLKDNRIRRLIKYLLITVIFCLVVFLIWQGLILLDPSHTFFDSVGDYPGAVKINQPEIEKEWGHNKVVFPDCTTEEAINASKDYKIYLTNDSPTTVFNYYKQQAGDGYSYNDNPYKFEKMDNALTVGFNSQGQGPNPAISFFTDVVVLDKVAQHNFIAKWFPAYKDKGNIIVVFKGCDNLRG
ncbi:MAG TPA: hypothetical protein VH186_00960 [Chloroflexia bacterium]|nr:hypothetical protein [Chloroflexia bacterium]